MKLLLDNCVPTDLTRHLRPHEVEHASRVGLGNLGNGKLLLAAADRGCDALVTVDRNLSHQQDVGNLPLAVIVLRAVRNTEEALLPLVPDLLSTLNQSLQRRVYVLGRVGKK